MMASATYSLNRLCLSGTEIYGSGLTNCRSSQLREIGRRIGSPESVGEWRASPNDVLTRRAERLERHIRFGLVSGI